MPKIGDYVISDGKITSVEKEERGGSKASYTHNGHGFGKQHSNSTILYDGEYQNFWRSKENSRLATIDDLKIFSDAIKENVKELERPEVKEFIRKATLWIIS